MSPRIPRDLIKHLEWKPGMELPKEGKVGSTPKPPRATPQFREGFIYVPSLDLYFSKERMHTNSDWYNCHKLLQEQDLIMPVIPQWIEFLKYIRDSDDPENKRIYEDIVTVRNPWRAEWFDARFEQREDGLYLCSGHEYKGSDSEGKIILEARNSIKLENHLMADRGEHINNKPGIDLNSWLERYTDEGLPYADIPNGELYYWHPRNNAVARFNANSGRAWLICDGDPSYRYASLGVRAVAKNLGGSS